MKFYTGVGSRSTPKDILLLMHKIAIHLADKEYVLRSGGADGADYDGFEKGCDSISGAKEIYLPWEGFNENDSPLYKITKPMLEMAQNVHPAWSKLRQGARKLHARNCAQVLGYDLQTPSEFLICWTEGGAKIGGTRTAIILAENHSIPVYNLAIEKQTNELIERINEL